MKAISYNLLAWAILPFMDTIAKYLSSDLSFFQITWARYFFTVFFWQFLAKRVTKSTKYQIAKTLLKDLAKNQTAGPDRRIWLFCQKNPKPNCAGLIACLKAFIALNNS